MSKHLLTSRGLVIVLKSHSRDYVSPGKQLFYHFQTANEVLYWNSNLYEAVHNCQLLGYILPSTLLLTGPDLFMETIKLAWSKRLLKAPKGYSIEMVGEFAGLEMRRVQQVHFIPLEEALCYIIYDLNCNNRQSCFETVCAKLAEWYRGMQLPPSELILNTLRQLIEKRLVYHTGYGYSILTNDKAAVAEWLVRLPNSQGGFAPEPVSPLKRSGSTSDISSLGGTGPYHSRRWSVREPLRRHNLRRFSPPPLPVAERSAFPWPEAGPPPSRLSHLFGPPDMPTLPAHTPQASPSSPPPPPPQPQQPSAQPQSVPPPAVLRSPVAGKAPGQAFPEQREVAAAEREEAVEPREARGKSPSLFRKLLSLGKAKRRDKGHNINNNSIAKPPNDDPTSPRCRPELMSFSGQFPPPEWLWYLNHTSEEAVAAGQRLKSAAQYPSVWNNSRRAASDDDLPSLPAPMQPLHNLGGHNAAAAALKAQLAPNGHGGGGGGTSRRGHGEKKRNHHHHHHHHHTHRHQSRSHRRSSRHQSTAGLEALEPDVMTSHGVGGAHGIPVTSPGEAGGGGIDRAGASGRRAKLRQSKSMHERLAGHMVLPPPTASSSVGTTPVQENHPGGFYDDSGFHSSRNTTEGEDSKCSMLKARYQQKIQHHQQKRHQQQHQQHQLHQQHQHQQQYQQQQQQQQQQQHYQQQQQQQHQQQLHQQQQQQAFLYGGGHRGSGHYGSLDRAVLRKHGWPPSPTPPPLPTATNGDGKSPGNSSDADTASASTPASSSLETSGGRGQSGNGTGGNGLETVMEASLHELPPANRITTSEHSLFIETDLDAAILAV